VQTLHAILAIQHELLRELIESRLLDSKLSFKYRLKIVARVDNEFAAILSLKELLSGRFDVDDPLVVIMSIDDDETTPASVSRLLNEFPEAIVIGIGNIKGRTRSFQLKIDEREVTSSKNGLPAAIRDCIKRQFSW
jgi:hypothetical protein